MNNLTSKRLYELLEYCPKSGFFTWRIPIRGVRPGRPAGTNHSAGYRSINIEGKLYFAHRLAWLYVFGEWPATGIDHINGDRSDNRIENLRLAGKSRNGANRGKTKSNTSGYKGVIKHNDVWRARIGYKGKTVHIGLFDDPKEAHRAYCEKARELFGEFAHV